MSMRHHTQKDYFLELRKQGITGELCEKEVFLSGWYNNIRHYGHYFCDNPQDVEKALYIFTECGFNYCKIQGTRCIEIMHDTKQK